MQDDKWTDVAAEAEIEEGKTLKVEVDGEEILLVRVKGRIHAFGNICTHHGGPLDEGLVVDSTAPGINTGEEIVCPWHHARFDLLTGRASGEPAVDDLPRYPVKVSAGRVHLNPALEPTWPETGILSNQTFAVIGAGAAGSAAVETLRKEGFAGRLIQISAEDNLPYDRTHLSKRFLAGGMSVEQVFLYDHDFYERHGIDLMLGRRVTTLQPGDKKLVFADGESLEFDQALIATGGVPRKLGFEGQELEGCFYLRSLADAGAISAAAAQASQAVVIGAGFIGLEAASALLARGLEVRVVAPEPAPMMTVFGERIGQWLRALHERNGVRFHLGETPTKITGDGRLRQVELSSGDRLQADMVVIGTGIVPVVDFLRESGLTENGSLPVNERLQTRADFVFAAGDIASVPDRRSGRRRRMEHWVEARRQGRKAACSMLGIGSPFDEVPFFWTKQHGVPLHYIGYAPSVDRLAYRGNVEDGDFLAGYYLQGKLRAVAGVPRARELIAMEDALRSGDTPSFEDFENPRKALTARSPAAY